ncbi:MAG: hypothetical protein QM734_13135 [Cyclobacteriaceae bacterium]
MGKIKIILALLVMTSCGNRVIYFGRSYSPSTQVDIFFRESDIKNPHEVMGKLVYEVSAKKRSEKVQNKLMNVGKKKGADAIIFDDIELTRTGSKTGGAAAGAAGKRGFLGIFGTKTKYEKGQQVKGTLLKYNN